MKDWPLSSGIERSQNNVNAAREDLQYMVEGQARVRASGGSTGSTQLLSSDKAPYLLIDDIIRKAGIAQPERVEPTGKEGARVQFSRVEFDKLVAVIAELERYGLKVSTRSNKASNPACTACRCNGKAIQR